MSAGKSVTKGRLRKKNSSTTKVHGGNTELIYFVAKIEKIGTIQASDLNR